MHATSSSDSPSPRVRPSRVSGRRRSGTAAALTVLFSIAVVGCGASEKDPGQQPTASYQETPRGIPGTEPSQETKDFHKYLLATDENKDLSTVSMDVKTEASGTDTSAQIITGLDKELRTPDSPDQKKAERLAKAFSAWRTEQIRDHGTVKVYNPAAETMATGAW